MPVWRLLGPLGIGGRGGNPWNPVADYVYSFPDNPSGDHSHFEAVPDVWSRKGNNMLSTLVHLLLWLTPWLSQAANAGQFTPSQDQAWVSALRAIVEAEHAFARSAGSVGTRDAFLAFIDADAVLFRPDPVAGKKYLLEHPASPE
jgi:hypothetical protein